MMAITRVIISYFKQLFFDQLISCECHILKEPCWWY